MSGVKLTKLGYQKLKEELKRLKLERPTIQEEVATAKAHGDLKENAEYHAAREKQVMLENRMNEIKIKLTSAEVVDMSDVDHNSVRFGAKVFLNNIENNAKNCFTIVGDDEADILEGLLSVDSPIAKGLLGKKIDDVVEIVIPAGKVNFKIISIEY